jgi:hypothetical protein
MYWYSPAALNDTGILDNEFEGNLNSTDGVVGWLKVKET